MLISVTRQIEKNGNARPRQVPQPGDEMEKTPSERSFRAAAGRTAPDPACGRALLRHCKLLKSFF